MTIIIAAYGQRYLSYLLALLDSLQHNAIDKIIIVYNDIEGIEKIISIFPSVIVRKYAKMDVTGSRIEKVAGKVLYWKDGAGIAEDYKLLFIDADTYFLQHPEGVFNDGFNIAYTVRDGRWRINTGVLFMRNEEFIRNIFFNTWINRIKLILKSNELIKDAISSHGAVDQLAFHQTILDTSDLLFYRELPCSKWNLCECTNNLSNAGIIHFKGCLPLLLKERSYGKEYGDERQPAQCEKMFNLWRESYNRVKKKWV